MFDPEKFLEDAQYPKYAYFLFGGGPSLCLGKDFAMTEIQLILATLLQKYNFILTPEHIVEPQALGGLRTRYGLSMNITCYR